MKKLIKGIVEFRKGLTPEYRNLFAKLALGQKPDALFIACSDSRVVPNLFASTNPGDLLVLRNIGNLVPPPESKTEESTQAGLEFAIFSLNIQDIIVCGHSECGAINALIQGCNKKCPHTSAWLEHARNSHKKVQDGLVIRHGLSELNQTSLVNVLQQIEHISRYPFVREKLDKGELRIHGWWFDIAQADVYCYEPTLNQFVLIDENESEIILNRLTS